MSLVETVVLFGGPDNGRELVLDGPGSAMIIGVPHANPGGVANYARTDGYCDGRRWYRFIGYEQPKDLRSRRYP